MLSDAERTQLLDDTVDLAGRTIDAATDDAAEADALWIAFVGGCWIAAFRDADQAVQVSMATRTNDALEAADCGWRLVQSVRGPDLPQVYAEGRPPSRARIPRAMDWAMPHTKLRATPPNRWKAPLPAEKIADMPFVLAGDRLIAPWPRGPLHFLDEARLLSVLARCDGLEVEGPVWIWPDPYREPVPVKPAGDPRSWVASWGRDRASYVTRQASHAGR